MACNIKYILIDDNNIENNNILKFINYTCNSTNSCEYLHNHVNYKQINTDYSYCGNIKYLELNYKNYKSFYNEKTKKLVELIYEKDFILLQNFDSIVTFPY